MARGLRNVLCAMLLGLGVVTSVAAKGASVAAGPRAASALAVAVRGPARPSPELAKTVTLLRGELMSLGLDVTLVARTDAPVAVTELDAELAPLAARGFSVVMDVLGEQTLEAVDIWLKERSSPRFQVTRVSPEPGEPRRAEIVVLRAVEALRGGLLALGWKADERATTAAAPPPPRKDVANATGAASNEAVRPAPAGPALVDPGVARLTVKTSSPFGVELGAAALLGLRGLGPALSPALGVAWEPRPAFALELRGAGWGSRSTVSAGDGHAEVGEQHLVLGARRRWRPERRLSPFVGAAGGLLHTEIEGQSTALGLGHHATRWSALVDLSGGGDVRLSRDTYLAFAAHARLAAPYVVVVVNGQQAATVGRPDLLLTVMLGARL